jgi:tryptophanyl-tRNA synthetase
MTPIWVKRRELEKRPQRLEEILQEGSQRASEKSRETLDAVKTAMKI